MKKDSLIVSSLIWSVLLHILFIGSSVYLAVPTAHYEVDPVEKMFNVQAVRKEVVEAKPQKQREGYLEKIKFEKPDVKVEKVLTEEVTKAKALPAPESFKFASPKNEIKSPEVIEEPAVDANFLKEKLEVKTRKVVNKESTVELDVLGAWESMVVGEVVEGVFNQPFQETMKAFTPTRIEGIGGNVPGGAVSRFASDVTSFSLEETAPAKYQSLDNFLHVEVSTYRDPNEKQGYYRIAIAPTQNHDKLPVIPKEVVFLVDASLSIQTKRLRSFKKGIEAVLSELNEGDRFNLITFKEDINSLAPKAVKVNPLSLNQALDFLDDLRASQRTDLYQAFFESLDFEESLLPSYIILLSDGRPNSGVVSPLKIISQITEKNARKRSIFAFSGGRKVNRYLLDFLSYQNRGWSEYAEEESELADQLESLYLKIKNPILTDIQFQIGQLDVSEVYPKHLPDFYKDTQFVVYGRYEKEVPFSFRVLGKTSSAVKELVSQHDLSAARSGDKEIAKNWAYNKVYHLMGKMAMEGQQYELLQEIADLRKRYEL